MEIILENLIITGIPVNNIKVTVDPIHADWLWDMFEVPLSERDLSIPLTLEGTAAVAVRLKKAGQVIGKLGLP